MSTHRFAYCPIRSRARRSLWMILALLVCGLTLSARAQAGVLDPILQGYWTQPSLESGNGNQIAGGRFNFLHAVFADVYPAASASDVVYADYDPSSQTWQYNPLSTDGTSYLPTLAVGSDGMAVVAWVSKPTPQSDLGSLWYRYQTAVNCEVCWSNPTKIAVAGTEPSVTMEGGTVHLAWTSGDRVQYTSFPKASPPSTPLWLGEVAAFANCPHTRFHQPSIAFVHPPCGALSLKIAALFAANEQATTGSCHDAATHVGPRVYERDNTAQTWSEVAFQTQEVASSSASSQPDPVPVSLSLNANRLTGDFYLAWSDETSSATRTRLGHGNGATWDFSTLDTQRHHVHVAARSGSYAGEFRLATGGQGWSTSGYTQTGKWSAGSLSWTGPSVGLPSTSDPLVGHPQALYWRRCASSQLREIKAYTEASPYLNSPFTDVATDLTQTGPVSCWFTIGNAVQLPPCFQSHLMIGQMLAGGKSAVVVDLGDTAVVTKLDAAGAELASFGGGTIQVTWTPGTVLYSWESGFVVATPRDSVRVSSGDARFTVEDAGRVGGK